MRKITNEELAARRPPNSPRWRRCPSRWCSTTSVRCKTWGPFSARATPSPRSASACAGITATPPNRDIHKTALGAELTVAWSYHPSTAECLDRLRAAGCTILAVEQVEGAAMLDDFRPEPGVRYALVFGNEVEGVGQEAVDRATGPSRFRRPARSIRSTSRCRAESCCEFFRRIGPRRGGIGRSASRAGRNKFCVVPALRYLCRT